MDDRKSFFSLVNLCVGAILLLWSAYRGSVDLVFAVAGKSVSAQVTAAQPEGHESQAYTEYSFTANGQTFAGTQEGFERSVGTTVRARYLPFHPETNELTAAHWFPIGLLALVIGAAALFFGIRGFWSNDGFTSD